MGGELKRLSAVVVGVLLLSACGGGAGGGSQQSLSIKVGFQPIVIGQAWAAQAKGLFKKNGLDVEFIKFTSGPPQFAALQGGEIDLAWGAATTFYTSYVQGKKTQWVVSLVDYNGAEAMVVPGDSSIKSVSDLAGKRIALAFNTDVEAPMKAMLAKNGVAPDSVKLLNMQPPQAVAALLKHDVDAAYIWAPFTQDVFSRGGRVLFTSADTPGGGWSYLGFATNSDWSKTHKEALVRFMKVLDQAFPVMQQDPQAMLNQAVQTTGMNMDTAQFIYKAEKYYPLSDNLKANTPISLCGLDQDKFGLGRVLKESQDFYLQKGVISQPGNIPGFVDGSFLKAYLKSGC